MYIEQLVSRLDCNIKTVWIPFFPGHKSNLYLQIIAENVLDPKLNWPVLIRNLDLSVRIRILDLSVRIRILDLSVRIRILHSNSILSCGSRFLTLNLSHEDLLYICTYLFSSIFNVLLFEMCYVLTSLVHAMLGGGFPFPLHSSVMVDPYLPCPCDVRWWVPVPFTLKGNGRSSPLLSMWC